MNKSRYILLAVCLLVLSQAGLHAQTYERVFRNNLWNGTDNITGIRQDSVSRSYAEIYGNIKGGEFRDTWEAEDGWSAGAATASIRHLEKISLAGSFSFRQTEGYGMCGSMFINPGYYPVDALEFTPGRKTLQTYGFDGGISYDASEHWRIGASMDFESANMAKRKDLRHTNWSLDMKIAPGLMYHSGDFAVGAAAIFRKTSETVDPEQVGTTESSYYAFLDKGLMYGVHSVWTGSGLHLDESGVNGFPVKEFSYGGSVQMQYNGFLADVEYLRTSGNVGEKEYEWFRFPGNSISADLAYRTGGRERFHIIRLGLLMKERTMSESVLEKVTSNGITTVHNHGWNRIYAGRTWSLAPEYEYISDRFEARINADIRHENSVSSQIYPYIFTRSLLTWEARGEVLFRGAGRFDFGLKAGYGAGAAEEEERMASGSSGVQTSPYRLQEWYDRHMEYETAQRMSLGLSLRWNFWKGLYAEAEGSWLHAFNLRHISGPNRYGVTMKFGYNF